ncbi:MAG: asparagine synthase-related protein [Pseudomonadota bacterium]|jgi:Asparagine synthase (glutamine-hydrolyzing)|nr:MAG: hypothetical protein DIU56_11285 [Pseudomonadota bacterium]
MGAIFGTVGGASHETMGRMYERLRHRGEQYELADPARGVMLAAAGRARSRYVASDSRYSLVVDGWVREKNDAERSGNDSPAETLLECYRRFGASLIEHVEGDFAFALWDRLTQTLFLGRDLLGVKPLFWTAYEDGGIAFASEYKALMALPGFDATVDRDVLQRVQGAKYLPMDGTVLFRSVRSVGPGKVLAIDPRGEPRQVAHAAAPPLAVSREPLESLLARIASVFESSVARRLEAAGRVGVALSGGIDSIGVAFACSRHLGDAELHTYTAGCGMEDPEVRTASLVSSRIGAKHHVVEVTPRHLADALPLVIWHLEAPIARTETVQFYELGRVAAADVDTMFTGAAADALYAGMPNYKILRLYELLPPLRRALHEFHSVTQTGFDPRDRLSRLMCALYFKGMLPPVPQIVGATFRAPLTDLPPVSDEFLNEYLQREIQQDSAQWLPKLERTLAASGIELASPFFDPETIRVAFSVPERYKIFGWREKYALRRALRQLVDTDLTSFQKFPMRMRFDVEFADALDELIGKYLTRERVSEHGLIDPHSLDALRGYRRRERYVPEGAMRAWTAIGTEIWAEEFIDRRGERPYEGAEPVGRTAVRSGSLA